MMNSIRQAVQAILKSTNPNQIIMQCAEESPPFREAVQAVNGKSPKQIKQMAYSIAKQRGIDLDALAKNLGIKLPE